jgi:hypothetical protein
MILDWLHFAERSGEGGKAWATAYRSHSEKLVLHDRALHLLREGQIEEGRQFLGLFSVSLRSLDPQSSVYAVMERWYHGVAGYYHYCVGEFGQAKESMNRAQQAVVRAISHAEWLVMLAIHCQEFCLHQARIARNERDWPEMNACVERARAMILDQLPLCEREDGKRIWFSSLRDFFAAMEPLNRDELHVVRQLVEPGERMRLFDQFVRQMLRFKEVGIDYSPPARPGVTQHFPTGG